MIDDPETLRAVNEFWHRNQGRRLAEVGRRLWDLPGFAELAEADIPQAHEVRPFAPEGIALSR